MISLRTRVSIALVIAVAILISLWSYGKWVPKRLAPVRTPQVVLNKQVIDVTVATSEADRERGLGGRDGLGANEGMLFVFPEDSYEKFWMKDMRFSIDMLWLSATGTVVYIAPNVSPDTYPQTFAPTSPARFVLELPAQFAKEHGIKVGDTAILPSLARIQ